MTEAMGEQLKLARTTRGLSLEAASGAAKISQGYLHKLEAGRVASPSPRVLQRLSDVLDIPYRVLMELAGYLMPADAGSRRPRQPLHESREAEPMAATDPAPTNAELIRLLEAAHSELAKIGEGQQRLVHAVERLAERGEQTA